MTGAFRRRDKGGSMADLLVVVALVAFFGLCLAFVRGCDQIIGPDAAESSEAATEPRAYSEIVA
jgi:hypothetical protein